MLSFSESQSSEQDFIRDTKTKRFKPKRVSFKQQFSALVIRNFRIKRRQYTKSLMELFFPALVFCNIIYQRPKFDVIPETLNPVVDSEIYSPPYLRISFSTTWYIINKMFDDSKNLNEFISILNQTRYKIYGLKIIFNTTFNNNEAFEKFYMQKTTYQNYLAISLDSYNNSTFQYSIRMEKETVPKELSGQPDDCLTEDYGLLYFARRCEGFKFFSYGFNTIQAIVDSSIIKYIYKSNGSDVPNFRIGIFPQQRMLSMNHASIRYIISLLSYGFLPYFSTVPVTLASEKEKKIKDAMVMMGLKILPYWFAWFFVEILMCIFPCVFITTVFSALNLTLHLNPICFYLLIQLYAISLIAIGFVVSTPFKSIRIASIFSSCIGLIIPWMYFGMEELNIPFEMKRWMSIFSPVAFSYTIKHSMLSVENIPIFNFSHFSFGFGFTLLVIEVISYFFLAISLDLFIINKQRVFASIFGKIKKQKFSEKITLENFDVEPNDDLKHKKLIEIQKVSKIFDKNSVAIDNLSLDIYESQITAILGQNGSGKTTLINMITGLTPPTFGNILICNLEVNNVFNITNLRTKFGVCFQEDILFEELTPLDHLRFYGAIKGAFGPKLKKEIKFLLSQTDLAEKKNVIASHLSGGQKRKLCIAIALVGGSQIIFLDEPTSGVDPYSRQKIRALLHSYKKNRVIIMTTHLMYEADVLADRKAILIKGKIRCVGSSLFLKKKFGIGYHLRLEIDINLESINHINELISNKISGAKLSRQTKSELIFNLPKSETSNFPDLFKCIDKIIEDKQGILSYGIKLTTLEDVFLKICYEHEEKVDLTDLPQQNFGKIDFNFQELYNITFKRNVFRICWEFLKIRIFLMIRNWPFLLSISIQAGSVVTFIVIISQNFRIPVQTILDKELYKKDQIVLYSSNFNDYNLTKEIRALSDYLEPIRVKELNVHTMVNRHYAIQFNKNEKKLHTNFQLTLIFDETYHHSLPILQNAITNMLIKSGHINSQSERVIKIQTANYPLPDRNQMNQIILIFIFIYAFCNTLVTFPIHLAIEVVTERNENIKSFLHINGMRSLHYWLMTSIAHSIIFAIFILLFISLFFVSRIITPLFKFSQISLHIHSWEGKFLFLLLFLLYIPTSLITCYILTHIFNRPEWAHITLNNICSCITLALFIGSVVMQFKFNSGILFQTLYFIWPFLIPFGCVFNIIMMEKQNDQTLFLNQNEQTPIFDWKQCIIPGYIALVVHFIIGLLILPSVDRIKTKHKSFRLYCWRKLFKKQKKGYPIVDNITDEDVLNEKHKVIELCDNSELSDLSSKPLLIIQNLSKKFKKYIALKCLNLIIESGQIFGLLGPNGAGKTTLIKVIAREEEETFGQIFLEGKFLTDELAAQVLSYCPQINPFWAHITVIEYLRLFATIRGIPSNKVNYVCQQFISSLGMDENKNKKFRKLSGGNKRKLCLLISILADVKLTLLDEPSTGMDPNSKRLAWNLLIKKFNPDSSNSAILSSHSMEEIEALCTRLTIMAQGSFKCLGNIQHLTNKYGSGYFLEIKFKNREFDFERIRGAIVSMFPNMRVTDQSFNTIIINVPQNDVRSLAIFFETMELMLSEYSDIEEYGLSQSSIEQVFIEFAKLHENVNL